MKKNLFFLGVLSLTLVALAGCKPTMDPEVIVNTPSEGTTIESPLTIEGEAKGGWYFEASFPVRLEDEEGNVLGETWAQAQEDWMTSDWVSFKAELPYFLPSPTGKGFLVFKKDNPSGLPEHDKSFKMSVLIPRESQEVSLYFGNRLLDPQTLDCSKTYPLKWTMAKSTRMPEVALLALLHGPTLTDTAETGEFSSIPYGTHLNSLTITDGVATADFDSGLSQVAGSCLVGAIRSEITETLLQFPEITDVVISVNGDSESALQP